MLFRLLSYSLAVLLLGVCACEQQSKTISPPLAEKGMLDLRNWDFERDGSVNLTGEYEFYWDRLLDPQDFIQYRSSLKADFISVPGTWNGFEYRGKAISGNGYATYRLTVFLNRSDIELAVKLLEMGTSYNLFINGQKISSAGVVGKTAESAKAGFRPGIIGFLPDRDELEVVVQISNFSHKLGGAWETIALGTRDQLQKNKELKIASDLLLFGSILIMGLYHLGLFSLRRKERSALFFGLFCLIIALRVLTTGERYILLLYPGIDYEIMVKLDYLTFYFAVPVFIQYFYSLFYHRLTKIICSLATVIGLAFGVLVILLPVKFFSNTLGIYQVFTLTMFVYATAVLVIASFQKEFKAIIFLAGFSILFLSSINDMLYARNIIQSVYMVQLGLFIFIFSQAYLLSRYFSNAFTTIEIQSEKLKKAKVALQKANDELEKRVEERTVELLKANEALRQEIEEREQAQQATKRAKRAAEIASRAKSEFLANMSHELRTPLNHIIGFTELVLDKNFGGLNETQEEYLNDVHSSSGHLLSLINDILDLSKVEAGKLDYQPTEVQLKKTLANSLIMIKEKAMKSNISVSNELDDIPESIQADERKLKQILYNLLSNAVKFTPNGGSIHMAAKRVSDGNIQVDNVRAPDKDYIQISITDSGIGLKKENLAKIFQPFEQVDSSSSRRFQGTGLGLSLTKSLVELHGGRIWAESDGEGFGAKFSFTLPV